MIENTLPLYTKCTKGTVVLHCPLQPTITNSHRWQQLKHVTVCHQQQQPQTHCYSFGERQKHVFHSQTADSLTLQHSPHAFL